MIKIIVEEKTTIVPSGYKIKSQGIFDLKELYLETYKWYTHHKYDWKETKYRDVAQPDGGKQIEVWWTGRKVVDDYITFVIELQLQAFVSDVETDRGGTKVKLQKGTVEFRSGAYMDKNVKAWGKKPMGLMWCKIYEIMIRARIERYKTELYKEAHKLYNEIKTYLEFYK